MKQCGKPLSFRYKCFFVRDFRISGLLESIDGAEPGTKSSVDNVCDVLNKRSLIGLSKRQLAAVLSKEIRIPAIPGNLPWHYFDIIFYDILTKPGAKATQFEALGRITVWLLIAAGMTLGIWAANIKKLWKKDKATQGEAANKPR